jgi:hypothetical protein
MKPIGKDYTIEPNIFCPHGAGVSAIMMEL